MTDADRLSTPRWFAFSRRACGILINMVNAVHSGFWMGVMRDSTFELYDVHPHQLRLGHDQPLFVHNELEPWERTFLASRFRPGDSVLLVTSDRGRELTALAHADIDVDAFDFSRQMIDESHRQLEENGVSKRVTLVPRYELPLPTKKYTGIWMCREYLSTIHGRKQRVEFLQQLRTHAADNTTLLCSFYVRPGNGIDWRINQWLGNAFRILTGNPSVPIELGDHLDPEVPLYHHHYLERELAEELGQAGWRMERYTTDWFGFAVATPQVVNSRPNVDQSSLQQA